MHKSTVSLALSGKGNVSAATRERIAAVARELGYAPNPLAQRLANGHRNGLVCLFCGGLDPGLTTEKILLIQKKLMARGLEVPIYSGPGPAEDGADGGAAAAATQAEQLRHLCRQRPRAVILGSYRIEDSVFEELEAYQREGGVVVSYDTPVPLACDQVVFDREDNAYRAARYLLDRGHRRLGIGMSRLTGRVVGSASDPQPYRLRGFERALRDLGGETRPEWSFRCATYEEGGEEMARQFLALPPDERPTGLCIVNDYVALAFLVEVMRAGVRVPEDLSVVSHDDQPVARFCPVPLTSVSHPADRIAGAVADLLLSRVAGGYDGPPRTVTITGAVSERASVDEKTGLENP